MNLNKKNMIYWEEEDREWENQEWVWREDDKRYMRGPEMMMTKNIGNGLRWEEDEDEDE